MHMQYTTYVMRCDGGGSIDEEEFQEVLSCLSLSQSKADIIAMMQEACSKQSIVHVHAIYYFNAMMQEAQPN